MIHNFNYLDGKTSSDFFNIDAKKVNDEFVNKTEEYWLQKGDERALSLFHKAAIHVPAYKNFLSKNKIDPSKIKTIEDFSLLPITDKKNYIQQYSLEELSWFGKLTSSNLGAVSSGMSGKATFWLRGGCQEYEAALVHELLYRELCEIHKMSTLLIVCFPMGIYDSGLATVLPSFMVTQKEYDLVMFSPGNKKQEILEILRNFIGHFEQVLLFGHPLLIKDVLETALQEGIDMRAKYMKLLFCSEGFTEQWRDYLQALLKNKVKELHAYSTYGSTEFLLMAYETPLSILFRKFLSDKKNDVSKSFHDKSVPNIFQYNPLWRFMEVVSRELIFTAASGLPLIRFNLKDEGELIEYKEVSSVLDEGKVDWKGKLSHSWKLPFVALYGRSDYSLVLHAAIIYPDNIKLALEDPEVLNKVTGKFVMKKVYDKAMNEFLEIHVELCDNLRKNIEFSSILQDKIVKTLREVNLEYLDASSNVAQDMAPRVILHEYQTGEYFKPGLKPRYIQ